MLYQHLVCLRGWERPHNVRAILTKHYQNLRGLALHIIFPFGFSKLSLVTANVVGVFLMGHLKSMFSLVAQFGRPPQTGKQLF